jgi:transposase
MRGIEPEQSVLFSYVNLESRVPRNHPLRTIKMLVDSALKQLSPRFDAMYARRGRPSVPPEQLLRALLLQIFYSVRSEQLLMEQLDYNLLFRWFVGLGIDDRVWVPETFSVNRDRLMQGDVAQAFFALIREEARSRNLLSDDHFTVDGTLLEAWASQKSFRPIDEPPDSKPSGRNPEVDFRGEKRSNATHRSTTDPDARLLKKGNTAAKLCYTASALMENRNGLIVDTEVEHATGTAECDSARAMLERLPRRKRRRTLGADKLYDTKEFVHACRELGVTPHVA